MPTPASIGRGQAHLQVLLTEGEGGGQPRRLGDGIGIRQRTIVLQDAVTQPPWIGAQSRRKGARGGGPDSGDIDALHELCGRSTGTSIAEDVL